ncbi:hypothetical protein CPSG_08993 [Coccidioides posadasii str. Silveira]|uniref:Uncharacterized protein n=1 Tax=Coccidioides posadasii (strain RMSCC 757 / Silveira) TaxID=443226 RepID=E9DGP4_COCPS|nr:hypothetical protein CPSG_08993 [Coccidioides posadasii str. Silveira]
MLSSPNNSRNDRQCVLHGGRVKPVCVYVRNVVEYARNHQRRRISNGFSFSETLQFRSVLETTHYRLEYPCVHRVASTAVFLFVVALHGALLAKWNLRAQGGGWLSVFIAKHVAFRIFVGENQKLVVLEWQAELP